ncbi:DUF411 domain-containing protein [Salinarimonas soli]|uniref:DUF411 domain-containing protein n=1 Tax=Salinarimonas soli TaxID=1638099 RepID=A0A5B2V857_9HYPH|nr:DUF411 domain-containing protein [Salinarimonas soli]KAA2235151.1 DUF411 domain-containing protein [Salinarimonas soli]
MADVQPTRRTVLAALALAGSGALPAGAATPLTVYKDPTCGCCAGWAKHMRNAGFAVTEKPVADLAEVKARAGVPAALQACHTAFLEGYVLEGHVPAHAAERLLRERPAIAGLAVPGMPVGSPGMAGPDPEAYDVMAFTKEGVPSLYLRVRADGMPG